jgi:predicted lipoprotein with Yx(FWY)xxD motif
MMKAALSSTLVLALAAGGALAAQPQGQAKIQANQQQPIGSYLTDSEGRSVYLFKADQANQSNCYDACAQAWPPVLTQGEPQAGSEVDPQMLGTIERQDGSMQVTYNGMPLYYFVKDQQAGDIAGQDVMGFGAEWYLVTPQGQVARAEGEQKQAPKG